ncbi:MAG: BON domain-containing protein [Gemmatimonadota bacterium]
MKGRENLFLGMILGAGLMYLLDPDRGRRRRALIRDQVVHGTNELEDLGEGVASRARHLRNRARGAMIEARTRHNEEAIDDTVLAARVRSELGRLVSTPTSVQVSAEHGRITLRGVAPEQELRSLVDGVQGVPGVHDVINRIESRENAG